MTLNADKLAIVALTRRGLAIAERLRGPLSATEVLCTSRAGGSRSDSTPATLADLAPRLLADYDAIVFVMALGIVVRVVGPLARDKSRDPAVVVVDEAGQFAISVLGGHRGGANQLARRVAELLGATPVITTASDVLGLPAVDLMGREFGWKLEREENLTTVASAVVNGQPVAVFQDAGERDWWQAFGPWPEHFCELASLVELDERFAALVVISDREVDGELANWPKPTLVFRPRSLAVGVGCRRGVGLAEVERQFCRVLHDHQLAIGSVFALATAWLKADEPALVEFARRLGVPLRNFSAEELRTVTPLPTPSETVFDKIGLHGVAEAAAMFAAGCRELIVTKQASESVTIAVARVLAIAGPPAVSLHA